MEKICNIPPKSFQMWVWQIISISLQILFFTLLRAFVCYRTQICCFIFDFYSLAIVRTPSVITFKSFYTLYIKQGISYLNLIGRKLKMNDNIPAQTRAIALQISKSISQIFFLQVSSFMFSTDDFKMPRHAHSASKHYSRATYTLVYT